MFESMEENDRPNGMRYIASLLMSVMTHATILCVIVAVPMIFSNTLRPDLLTWLNLKPIHFSPPVPAVAPPSHLSASTTMGGKGHTISMEELAVPKNIPEGVLPEPPPEDIFSNGAFGDGKATGLGISSLGEPGIGKIEDIARFIEKRPITIQRPLLPKGPVKSIRVGGDVQASKLIYKVVPTYPELARRARVSGVVILMAIIDEEGNVADLKVLSGHPLLVNAAHDAVKQWKYSPTVLNGEPMTVQATINVIFSLQ
jgi:periplasmic protein TonB